MRKTYIKNLLRDIKGSLSRFLSIVIIISVGVAFYSGVRATSPDMKKSADYYFNKNNLMDFKLISTLGLTKNDISEVEKIKGITKVQGTYSVDATIEQDQHSLVMNILSMPKEGDINNIRMVTGRTAEIACEAVVEDRFLEENNLKLGDKIVLQSGNDSSIGDSLKSNEFVIVGSADSPLFVSEQRQLSSVGNGAVKGFLYILPEVFKSDVYTEIYVRTEGSLSENSMVDYNNYKISTGIVEKELKDLGVVQSEARYNEVINNANDKINEAQDKLDESKKEAAAKFDDAKLKLSDAQKKVNAGNQELKRNQQLFNQKIADGEAQIAYGKRQIELGEAQINAMMKKIENGNLKDAEIKLEQGKAALEANKEKIAQEEWALNKAKQQGQAEFIAAGKKLTASQNEIDENTAKLKAEEESANGKFKEAEAEIQKNRDKLKEIKIPDFYVLGRSANVGYETYRQDSDRIDNIGKAFPMIFFLVAALVCLTTMTRMVQEKRIEIGTFKALGYSRSAIVAHYLIYSLSASLIGSLIGIFIGFRLFPPLIMNAYSSLYTISDSITLFNNKLAIQASLIAVLFVVAASVAAALGELREAPASLMRPKPPKSGKSILLEKMTFIWKRLSFTEKVTARNIFRYKQRFFMTVLGIAACTGLMITGFGLKGAITGATDSQFNTIYKYDMQTTLTKNIDDTEKANIKQNILKDTNVKSVLFTYSKNSTVKNDNSESQDAYLIVPENIDEFSKYINLTVNNKKVKFSEDGVVITQKLLSLLHKKVGDDIEITVGDKVLNAKITAVTEQYIQHYIYMSPAYYEKLTGGKTVFNNFYGLLENTSESLEDETAETLTSINDIGSVSFKNKIQFDFGKTMKSIDSVVLVLIISAGVLAFIVIYNLTNINMNERKSELATIKLLGFYNSELASYIYRENMILTVIGSLAGIGLGILMDKYVIITAETNILTFYKKIDPMYFLYSVLLTILFSLIVNLTMYKRFDKIDMIESLKSPE